MTSRIVGAPDVPPVADPIRVKSYVVGGAVRDRLLGLPVVDRDHVVIGATVDQMLEAGFRPVGRDFPVFLHPETHEEYALARTERKVAPGYAGFVFHADPTVTLAADLERRDLTINAIAEDEATGELVDPFDGRGDLARRLFRHVGQAFVEDPVRLLRVARFAARFTDFSIATGTLALMRDMTYRGEVDALVPERVWQEVARGLMEARPSRMIDVLRTTGALRRLLPELDDLFADAADGAIRDTLPALDRAAARGNTLEIRFAVLLHRVGPMTFPSTDDDGKSSRVIEALCRRLVVPSAARELAIMVRGSRTPLIAVMQELSASSGASIAPLLIDVMEQGDAFRRGPRFLQSIEAVGCTIEDDVVRSMGVEGVTRALEAARAVDAGAIARAVAYDPRRIVDGVRAARLAALEQSLGESPYDGSLAS